VAVEPELGLDRGADRREKPLTAPHRLVALAAIGLVALAPSSCGNGADKQRSAAEIRMVADEVGLALQQHDFRGICRQLTRSGRGQVGIAAHQDTTCQRNVGPLAQAIARAAEAGDRPPKPLALDVQDDRARLTVGYESGATRAVPFAHEDGRWKLDAFVGAPLEPAAPPRLPGSTGPAVRVREVVDGRRIDCPPVDTSILPTVTGGCSVEFTGRRLTLWAGTVAGAFPFTDCSAKYTAQIARDGEMWIDDFSIRGDRGCSDALPCSVQPGDPSAPVMPWAGRIYARPDGDFGAKLQICFATCVGQFEGRLELDVPQRGRRWRGRSDASTSGLDVQGAWRSAAQLEVSAPAGD
jgi:hypothetical protein